MMILTAAAAATAGLATKRARGRALSWKLDKYLSYHFHRLPAPFFEPNGRGAEGVAAPELNKRNRSSARTIARVAQAGALALNNEQRV